MAKKKFDPIPGAPEGYVPPYMNRVDPIPYIQGAIAIIWLISIIIIWGRPLYVTASIFFTLSLSTSLVAFIYQYIEDKNDKSINWEGYGIWLLICTTISISITSLGFKLFDWYTKIPAEPSNKFIALTGIFALSVGGVLYLVRRKYRILWGITEIAAGTLIAMYRTFANGANINNANPEYFIAILTAGIYLIVRGFDNIEQGKIMKEKKLEKELETKLKAIREKSAPPSH